MMLRLSSISLTSHISGYWRTSLPFEFCDAFTSRLRLWSSTLEEVSINSFANFPLREFRRTMKRITLNEYADPLQNDFQSMPFPALDSLSLRNWRANDPGFLAWAKKCIPNLRFLFFQPYNPPGVNNLLPELVGMCSNSLQSLDLNIRNGCKFSPSIFFFSTEQYCVNCSPH
jgi:hypothetical protein